MFNKLQSFLRLTPRRGQLVKPIWCLSCSNQTSQTCISHWTPTKPNFAGWSAQTFPELICPFTNLISPQPATHPATPGWFLPWTSLHQMTKPVLPLTIFQQITIGTIQAHDLYDHDQVQTSIKDNLQSISNFNINLDDPCIPQISIFDNKSWI